MLHPLRNLDLRSVDCFAVYPQRMSVEDPAHSLEKGSVDWIVTMTTTRALKGADDEKCWLARHAHDGTSHCFCAVAGEEGANEGHRFRLARTRAFGGG